MKYTPSINYKCLILLLSTLPGFFIGCARTSSSAGAPPSSHDDATLAIGAAAVAEERKDAKTLNAEAYELIARDQFEEAIAKLKRALQMDPNFAEAYKNVALAQCDWGRPELGLRAAEQALALAPNYDKAQFVMGKILLKLGRTDESIKHFQKAIELSPKYDKAYYWLGLAYDRANDIAKAQQAFADARRINPDEIVYLGRSLSLKGFVDARTSGKSPALKTFPGKERHFAIGVYSQIFYEALVHQDYDLLEKSAAQARSSREQWLGGKWKLQFIYDALETPLDPAMASEFEWQNHLNLLQKWVDEKPKSITARVALAETYFRQGWQARGYGPASVVPAETAKLFRERLTQAKTILLAEPASETKCPQWFQLMLGIATAEGWDRNSYEDLYNRAVKFEPAWEDFYGAKALRLLPQWGGSADELQQFLEDLLATADRNGPVHFLFACQAVARYGEEGFPADRKMAAAKLKEGLERLQGKYGATGVQLNWAAFTAVKLGDKSLAKDLLNQIGDNWNASVWAREAEFEFAKKWAES